MKQATSRCQLPGTEGEQRLHPRPWDYSYYLLKQLRDGFSEIVESENTQRSLADEMVVDFGCGTRPYEPLFQKFGAKYVGTDLDSNKHADLHFNAQSRIPLDTGIARIVFSSQVLEHVADVPTYLNECRRLLEENGLLILSTHGFWTYHGYPDDFRRWTRQGLIYDVQQQGFEVETTSSCVGPLAYTTHLRTQLLRGALFRLNRHLPKLLFPLLHSLSAALMALGDSLTPSSVTRENAAVFIVTARKR